MAPVSSEPSTGSIATGSIYDSDDDDMPQVVLAKRKLSQNPSVIIYKRHVVDLGDIEADDIAENILHYHKYSSGDHGSSSSGIEDPENPRGRSEIWRDNLQARSALGEDEEEEEEEEKEETAKDSGYSEPVVLEEASTEDSSEMSEDYRRKKHSYPPVDYHQMTFLDGVRIPKAILELPLWRDYDIPDVTETFSLSFLKKAMGVSPFVEGWYTRSSKKRGSKGGDLDQKALDPCMIFEGDHQPLLPILPCEHGAQITPFLQGLGDEIALKENLIHIPLFIKRGTQDYEYYGTYREAQLSDRLGANEMRELPDHVKNYWGQRMGERPKPSWAIHAIKEAWPKSVVGWLSDDKQSIIDYTEEFEEALGDPLKSSISDSDAEAVTVTEILHAFENPDIGNKPALRLYFKYMRCDGYDRAFYDKLAKKKNGK